MKTDKVLQIPEENAAHLLFLSLAVDGLGHPLYNKEGATYKDGFNYCFSQITNGAYNIYVFYSSLPQSTQTAMLQLLVYTLNLDLLGVYYKGKVPHLYFSVCPFDNGPDAIDVPPEDYELVVLALQSWGNSAMYAYAEATRNQQALPHFRNDNFNGALSYIQSELKKRPARPELDVDYFFRVYCGLDRKNAVPQLYEALRKLAGPHQLMLARLIICCASFGQTVNILLNATDGELRVLLVINIFNSPSIPLSPNDWAVVTHVATHYGATGLLAYACTRLDVEPPLEVDADFENAVAYTKCYTVVGTSNG